MFLVQKKIKIENPVFSFFTQPSDVWITIDNRWNKFEAYDVAKRMSNDTSETLRVYDEWNKKVVYNF